VRFIVAKKSGEFEFPLRPGKKWGLLGARTPRRTMRRFRRSVSGSPGSSYSRHVWIIDPLFECFDRGQSDGEKQVGRSSMLNSQTGNRLPSRDKRIARAFRCTWRPWPGISTRGDASNAVAGWESGSFSHSFFLHPVEHKSGRRRRKPWCCRSG
jgi:hypothetical protein